MGIISTKLISIYVGLNGISLLEYFRNFTSIAESTSQMGLQNGIIKQIANSKQKEQEQKIFSTALVITSISTFITISLCVIFNKLLQHYLFHSTIFEVSFFTFLLILPSTSLQMLIINTLNGKQLLKKIIWINSIGYLINIFLSYVLIKNGGLQGALFQIAITPLIINVFTWFYSKKSLDNISFSFAFFDKNIAKNLLGFTLMNLVSSILTPFSFIFIRNCIDNLIGETEAGIWSSIIRISVFYMMFISSICSLYFFPLLSKEENFSAQKSIFVEYYKKFIPIIGITLSVLYFSESIIIPLLFTKDFLVLTEYFYLQLIADFIRSCALIFGYQIIAKRNITFFIFSEIISVGGKMILTYLYIQNMGLYGVFIANIISIFIYLILVGYYSLKKQTISH